MTHSVLFRLLAALLAGCLLLPANAMAEAEVDSALRMGEVGLQVSGVTIDGRVLFRLRGVTAFPADRRAAAVRDRIIALATDRDFSVTQLKLVEEQGRTTIMGGNLPIVAIYDVDAALEGIGRQLLAEVYVQKIGEVIEQYRTDRSPELLAERAFYAVAVTVLLGLLVWGARLLFRWMIGWSERHVRRGVQELASKSHYLIRPGPVWGVITTLIRLLRTLVYLALAYTYFNTVLGLFPWTRPVARVLFALILDPLRSLGSGLLNALPNFAFLVILFLIVRYLLKVLRAFFVSLARGRIQLENFDPDWADPTFKIVRVLVIALAAVIAYPYIPGSDSLAFKGVSVFAGILLSLGSSSFISNMIAGLSMTYRGAFKVGDRVKVGDVVGAVEDVKLLVTRIRTPKNERVILPNSSILSTEVVNYSQLALEEGVVLYTTVGIGYDTPWRQVEAMLLEAARRTEGLLQDPPPFVLQTGLGDFAVNYQINAYTNDATCMPRTYSALHANIQDVFNEFGVQIMSPAYEADPTAPKVVPPDQWYAAPAQKPGSDGG